MSQKATVIRDNLHRVFLLTTPLPGFGIDFFQKDVSLRTFELLISEFPKLLARSHYTLLDL